MQEKLVFEKVLHRGPTNSSPLTNSKFCAMDEVISKNDDLTSLVGLASPPPFRAWSAANPVVP